MDWLVNDRISMALHCTTYCIIERVLHYEYKVAKHVAKWVSRLLAQRKAYIFDPMKRISIIGFLHAF